MIYKLSFNKEYPLYDNSLPIHRKVYDKANMNMYEIHLKIKQLNPACELVGIKTDCLIYNKIHTEPTTSEAWGDIKKREVPTIHECVLNNVKSDRNDAFELTGNEWVKVKYDTENGYKNDKGFIMDNGLPNYVENGILFLGMAGTGKSEILSETQLILQKNDACKTFMTACPTHKALR